MKWSRLGLALLTALQVQTVSAGNMRGVPRGTDAVDSGFFPIDISPTGETSVDDLFPTTPRIGVPQNGNGSNNGSNGQNGNNNGGGRQQNGNNNGGNNNNNNNNNNNGNNGANNPGKIYTPVNGVKDEFKCNLFTNSDYSDILSAANALTAAVGAVNCSGNGPTAQTTRDNVKTITDNLKLLKPALDNPGAITTDEQIKAVTGQVDAVISAVNTLGTTLGNASVANKECRDQMNKGQIALSINNMINGLTPLAMMVASLPVVAGAVPLAVPFVVGTAAVTGTIASVGSIISESAAGKMLESVKNADVRRAIIENTCQYIRLDQKYRFLSLSRDAQVKKLSLEMDRTRNLNLMSFKISGASSAANSYYNRKSALDEESVNMDIRLASAAASVERDKQFVKANPDNDVMICSLGIQLATTTDAKDSYISPMLNSTTYAMAMYGSNNVPQANALKMSGDMALRSLKQMSTVQFDYSSDLSVCVRATKSLLETAGQSASLSKQLIKLAQSNLDAEMAKAVPMDYVEIQTRSKLMKRKVVFKENLKRSLNTLSEYAKTFTQSEIDAEMDRLRGGLFGKGSASPVLAWFRFMTNLENTSVTKFKDGFQSLKNRAYRYTSSGNINSLMRGLVATTGEGAQIIVNDQMTASKLRTLTLKNIKKGSQEYYDTCREMKDVSARWVTIMDHLRAMESFCLMIDNYIFDGRSEDSAIVQMCRGRQKSAGVGNKQSDLGKMKYSLKDNKTDLQAALVDQRIKEFACPETNTF